MAKDKRILIEFDQDIITGFEQDNKAAFSVTGKKYQYVGGPLINATYPVTSVNRPGARTVTVTSGDLTLPPDV